MDAPHLQVSIALIGGGNMAQALIGGLLRRGVTPSRVHVVEPHPPTRSSVAALGVHVAEHVDAQLGGRQVVVLAIKPQLAHEVCAQLREHLPSEALVVSVAAGIRATDLARWLGTQNVVRTMPNTPALIGQGITGLAALPGVSAEHRSLAQSVLACVGQTIWVDDESMLDAVTAISGSGPAYVFLMIEALETAAREVGLSADAARTLAITTFVGASQLAAASHDPLALLRERVTSKGGTTQAALEVMQAQGLLPAIVAGVRAAALRSRELGDEFGRGL